MQVAHNDDPMKVCSKCSDSLPADTEFFYSNRRSKDGLRSVCKVCYSELPSVRKRNQRGSQQ